MDDPPFYRDDLQAYYDLQLSSGKDQAEAVRELKKKFKVRSVTVTPTGEVRSPGVVDNPSPPDAPAAPPPDGGDEPPPETDGEDPGSQMGDEDPSGKDVPPPPKNKDRNPREDRCEIPDAVWLEFLRSEGDLDNFERWALQESRVTVEALACWEAPDLDEHWRPSHLPKRSGSLPKLSSAQRSLYERFKRLINMRAGELRAHLRSSALREMVAASRSSKRKQLLEGRKLARYVLRMKASLVEEWDEALWARCREVVTTVERARRNSTPVLDERGDATRKLFVLRSLGHNPTVRAHVTESEIAPLLEDVRALHRYIDATPGLGLVALVAEGERALDFDALKQGKVKLSAEEHAEVMDKGATWNHGPDGQATPAVWKSAAGGRTSYVTATHRMYQVRPTLQGAISAYHRVVKQTA